MNETAFAQLSLLLSGLALLFGIVLLWRRSLHAYIDAFQWQSVVLAVLLMTVGYFEDDPELYLVAIIFFLLKAIVIPRYLNRLEERVGGEREMQPYVNAATSLVVSSMLVLLAYVITRPLVLASTLPTRGGLPLALGVVFVGLFVVITRKKALTQVVGFLVIENGVALMAILGTLGIPLLVELGVFLDLLMGFLVMQVFIYHIHGTFDSIDVEQLNQLKH